VLAQGWVCYQRCKKDHAALLKQSDEGFTRPWQVLNYAGPTVVSPLRLSAAIPMVFLEPLRIDYASFLAPLSDRPALFVFETRAKLIQQLQFPAVVESLCMPNHVVYVMDVYPHQQFASQDCTQIQGKNFEVFLIWDRPLIRPGLPLLQQAIQECLRQPFSSFAADTAVGNWLYEMSKRLLFSLEEERLGVNRAMALHEYLSGKQWHDLHKGLALIGKSLGPEPIDYQKVKLSQLAEQRFPRVSSGSRKIKLVHVVPQIIDDGHAPSRLLDNLVTYHDNLRFDLHVVSTERLQFHWLEYPYNLYNSESSSERAPHRIAAFQKHGCNVHILNSFPSFEQTARYLAKYIGKVEADIVVFHGPDVINNMAAQMTDAPLRAMFDHGTLPSYRGYDLVIASTPVTLQKYLDLFKEWKTQVQVLPFAIDVKSGWLPQPFSLDNWGVPIDSLLITTISQHLDNRLSSEMLLAIAEILQRVSNAYYVPIGKVVNTEKFLSFFRQRNLEKRVIFMGQVDCPSQYARSMYLYLNEFPFGSGLGMLDAMASGCPVVSMYDPKGPPQARYGGQYMGIEWTVESGKRKDYDELACRLLTDGVFYRQWSEQALKQYEKYADVKGHVKAFEEIVVKALVSSR
jgi:glycosyltransferase involved in cell wall biosynthesis